MEVFKQNASEDLSPKWIYRISLALMILRHDISNA